MGDSLTIGEHHPYKLINGRLHRLCYRNKWIDVTGTPMDWRHYEGQEKDEKPRMNLNRFYKIIFHGAPDAR